MDPTLAAAISTLTGTVSVAILMYATYKWPKGYHDPEARKNDKDEVE